METEKIYGTKVSNNGEQPVQYPKLPSKFKEEQRQYKLMTKQVKKSSVTQEGSKNV